MDEWSLAKTFRLNICYVNGYLTKDSELLHFIVIKVVR
jgi:hypothetical protein